MKTSSLATLLRAGTALILVTGLAGVGSAAPIITAAGIDYSMTPTTFSFGDSSFTFSGTGDWFAPTAVQSGGTGQFNTIFGQPTTNFPGRGSLSFGPSDNYGAFATPTTISYSNGENFIGLRATAGTDVYYGFAYTSNSVLNSYGFESVAGRAIIPTVASGAVPEPASWAMMVSGFGMIGGAMRSRRRIAFA